MTPFEILYGRPPPTVSRYIRDSSGNAVLEAQLMERDHVLSLLKLNLHRAQNRMKSLADQGRRDVTFQLNDWVYVKLQPFRQNSVRLKKDSKLGRRYFGPYKVIARIGEVAYRLELPVSAQIHPVFHVSLLKRCIGNPDQQITPLHLADTSSTPAPNLKDKVSLKGDGNVVITNDDEEQSRPKDVVKDPPELRRSSRPRARPSKLADYV